MPRFQNALAGNGLTRRQALRGAAGGAGFLALGGCATGAGEAASPVTFTSGVASGDPTPTAIVIWTRAVPQDGAYSASVDFEMADGPDFATPLRRGAITTSAARDYTVKADIQGLQPGRTYYYRFRAGGVVSPVGRTRTLPGAAAQSIRLALASCANYPSGFFNGYREISRIPDLDAVIHVGDYIYEYGPDGYDGDVGATLGRVPDPPHEVLTLADYRRRFAQYRSDADLQAAHAHAPFITVWDDHETANNSWMDGASNHDPGTEGRWRARRDAAIQAYFEWLPMRDPEPGAPAERLNRVYDFGQIASLIVIETRLTGRDRQLDYPDDIADPAARTRFESEVLDDPSRTMMGARQEAWLDEALAASRRRGAAWQVLANQTVMARMASPDFTRIFPQSVVARAMAAGGYSAGWLERSKYGLPVNLDSWDGYPAARRRLYDSARRADARMVVLSGDSHLFWANNLHHPADGGLAGIEFATAGVTSPGGYENFGDDPAIFEAAARGMIDHNPDVAFANLRDRGFVQLDITAEAVEASYVALSTILSRDYTAERFLRVRSEIAPERRALAVQASAPHPRAPQP